MQNHCEKTSSGDVMPVLAQFVSQHLKEEFTEAPVTVQEMFNNIMDTHWGDDLSYRQRMLGTLSLLQDFAGMVEPFTQDQLDKAGIHE